MANYTTPYVFGQPPSSGVGSGTVTSVSVTTANGVSGSVATATTTPAITLTLGAITPTTVNGLTVSTTTGTLTLANGSTLVTSGAFSTTLVASATTVATLPSGTVTLMANPMTTGGDIIYGGASGVPTRLANGSSGQVLTSAGSTSAPTWETPSAGACYGAKVYRSGALSVSHLSTAAIAFDAETFDSNALHDTVTNNSRIVLNKVGKWRIDWGIVYAANASGQRYATIMLNGATVVGDKGQLHSGASTTAYVSGSNVITNSAITDYIEMLPYQDSGGTLALTIGAAYTYMSAIFEGT